MTDQSLPKTLFAITLYSENLDDMRAFYNKVFGAPAVFEGDTSTAYKFGDNIINVIDISGAPELVEPAPIAPAGAGSRCLFTIHVDDVDAVYQDLVAKGIEILNGPQDREWGPRTIAFADPAGNVWEIAS